MRVLTWKLPLVLAFVCIGGHVWADGPARPNLDLQKELHAIRGDVRPIVELNRQLIAGAIAHKWTSEFDKSYGSGYKPIVTKKLGGLSAAQLYAAGMTDTFAEVQAALAGQLSRVPTKALGDVTADVVYTPVTPCRIVDTRYGAGGTLLAGDTRHWLASNPGGTFAAQGGSNTDCGIPVKPVAVMVNLTVANTGAGPAFLVGWPYNRPKPTAASLNWVAAGTQLANAIILPLCTAACGAADWSLFASGGTDLIVDVVGYFRAPSIPAVSVGVISGTSSLPSGMTVTLGTNTNCAPGLVTFNGACYASSYFILLSGFYLNGLGGYSCDFISNSGFTQTVSVAAYCISPPAAAR